MSEIGTRNNIRKIEKVDIYDDDDAYILNDDHNMDDQIEGNENNEEYYENNAPNQDNLNDLEEFEEDLAHNNMNENHEKNNLLTNSLEELNSHLKESEVNYNNQGSKLITLKYVSVCQCCKQNFNSQSNIPYLLKCGHFFCKVCIMKKFYDENNKMILCPEDGAVAKSLSDLKLLKNLIIESNDKSESKSIDEKDERNEIDNLNFCKTHPNQIISYYIENTNELICVYCAFNKFKSSPNLEIKELPLKCREIIKDLEEVIKDNKQYAQALENFYPQLKKNREEEEQNVKHFFEKLLGTIQEKYNNTLENLSKIYSEDGKNLTDKLEQTAKKIEIAETIKYSLEEVIDNKGMDVASVFDAFSEFSSNYQNKSDYITNVREYKFSYENAQSKYLKLFDDDFSLIKTKTKQISLVPRYNENNRLDKRNGNSLHQKTQYTNNYNQANYTINTSQNDYNNIISTEDYFGDKKVLRMSDKSYQVTASRSGRNEYKNEINSQNYLPSNNTFYLNSPINPYSSFEYSKQRNLNSLKLESRGDVNKSNSNNQSYQQNEENKNNVLRTGSANRYSKDYLLNKRNTPDVVNKLNYL